MTARLSRRGYARHREARGLQGGTDRAVRKALATGRIHLEADGKIDAAKADRAWQATTPARVFQNGHPMAETLARLRRSEVDRPSSMRMVREWAPTDAQVRRWTKCREQLKSIDGRLAAALLSPHVPDVPLRDVDGPYRPLRCRDVPIWAHRHPRFYALRLAEEHVSDALIELSRVVGYPGYTCPEDK
jgi:hypothetical protein